MGWWPFSRRTPDDDALAGGGPRLLVASFGRLVWYFPRTDRHRFVHEGRGKYYGMAPADGAYATDGRLLVVSRPDQARDDRLLVVDHLRGETRRKLPLASRDTHHAVCDRDRLFVTDTFRGRVLEYALPDLVLVRALDQFTHEDHVNTVLVQADRIWVLCHNKGESSLAEVDRASGETLRTLEGIGAHSHDLARWRDRLVVCDSRGGGLIHVDPATGGVARLFAEEGSFTKGLAVEDDTAWFAISRAATREERTTVSCDLVELDLQSGRVAWRRPIPSGGLVNSIVTHRGLLRQLAAPTA